MLLSLVGIVTALGAGCASGIAVDGDEGTGFLGGDGVAMGTSVAEGSPEAVGVLAVANAKNATELHAQVGLATRAATHIAAHRAGHDGVLGTSDDVPFTSLAALDAVSYVGPSAFGLLLAYAEANGFVHGGGDVCAMHHAGVTADGDPVEICDRVFDAAPRVRPLADVRPASGAVTLYVSVSLAAGINAIDRQGTSYVLVDSTGAALSASAAHAGLPASMRLPSHRDMFLIYRVTGTIGSYADPYSHAHLPSLNVTAGAPAILLTGNAIDGAFEGVWEGDVSARTSTGFDVTHRVPLRVRFDHLTAQPNLHVWSGTTTLRDGQVFALEGSIENWSSSVRSSDGRCLGALTAMGTSSPFHGATSGALSIFRMGGMHFPADEVVVVMYPAGTEGLTQEGMTGLHVMTPADLMRISPTTDELTLDLFPHGAPNGNSLVLRRVASATTTASCR